MGGVSAEREVSLHSGEAVVGGLRTAGYQVEAIDVQRRALDLPEDLEAVFVALHGEFGEDGEIQTLLREIGMPYTGSGPEACRRAFDKVLSKQCFEAQGLPTPLWTTVREGSKAPLPLPIVVKPIRQGSSLGVRCVERAADWESALSEALRYGEEALVEAYIPGRELTVGIVGDRILPVLEILPPEGFYSYEAKYTTGCSQYQVPAMLERSLAETCQRDARGAYEALGCSGFARVDLRLDPDGRPWILEVNAIPGFTATSLLPKAALADGLAFPELCDLVLRSATVH